MNWIEIRETLFGGSRWILWIIPITFSFTGWMLFFSKDSLRIQGQVVTISTQPFVQCIELSDRWTYNSMWVVTGSNGDVDLEQIDTPCPIMEGD